MTRIQSDLVSDVTIESLHHCNLRRLRGVVTLDCTSIVVNSKRERAVNTREGTTGDRIERIVDTVHSLYSNFDSREKFCSCLVVRHACVCNVSAV